jgi:hypothetical protein
MKQHDEIALGTCLILEAMQECETVLDQSVREGGDITGLADRLRSAEKLLQKAIPYFSGVKRVSAPATTMALN